MDNMKNLNLEKIIKYITVLVILIIMYLFALNGRYSHYESVIFDKWTGKSYVRTWSGEYDIESIKN